MKVGSPEHCSQEGWRSVRVGLGPGGQCLSPRDAVSEVYPGDTAQPEEEFVELQMFAAGQNILSGLHVRLYDASGNEVYEDEFGGTAANGSNQATVLSGDDFFDPDRSMRPTRRATSSPAGGAACFTSDVFTPSTPLDCVAWGSFNDPPPSAVVNAGTPEAEIPDASSITRTQARGCATQLEGVDDSNDSDADFSARRLTPRNNAGPITEVPCGSPPPPGGGSTTPVTPPAAPKKKCKKGQKLKKGKCVKKKRKKRK